MDEERRQVLDMVAAGTISAEQGDELLAALEGPTPRLERTERVLSRGRREERSERSEQAPTSAVDRLAAAARYGVTPEFIDELRELGYSNLSLEDLIGLARYGADASFIRQMHELGFTNLTVEELVRLSRFGVDADLVRAMRDSGLIEPSAPSFSPADHEAAAPAVPAPLEEER